MKRISPEYEAEILLPQQADNSTADTSGNNLSLKEEDISARLHEIFFTKIAPEVAEKIREEHERMS